MTIRRHPGLELAAIVLLLFSAMLDPVLTVGLAAALLAGGFVLAYLGEDRRDRSR
ncbi:MAG TPA: hypothetical protein VIU37_06015 [Candidatus Limnocylindrales bacterium]|jgi:hypothetical protein